MAERIVNPMGNVLRYQIDNLRVIRPTGKVAEKNPDRAMTLRGKFHEVKPDAKGNLVVSTETLTFGQKDIDWSVAGHPDFVLDRNSGMLTLPAGERGRKATEGLSGDDIDALLAEARERANAEEDAEEESDEATPTA